MSKLPTPPLPAENGSQIWLRKDTPVGKPAQLLGIAVSQIMRSPCSGVSRVRKRKGLFWLVSLLEHNFSFVGLVLSFSLAFCSLKQQTRADSGTTETNCFHDAACERPISHLSSFEKPSSLAWVVPHSHLISRPQEVTTVPVPALSLFTHPATNGKPILPAMGSLATATGALSQKSVAGLVQD